MTLKSEREKSKKLLKLVLGINNYALAAAAEPDKAKWDAYAAEAKLMNDKLSMGDDMCGDESPEHYLDRWIGAHEALIDKLGIEIPEDEVPPEEDEE